MRTALPETAAVLRIRRAVRDWLAAFGTQDRVVVALSGGADSLALTAAAVAEHSPGVVALIVDHQLQAESAQVAEQAARQAMALGCLAAYVIPVSVGSVGGLEAAARSARYHALDMHRDGCSVLVAHTLDDQAETVLLGLARGSGGRSVQGMAARDGQWGRPLLTVRRTDTEQMCADLGLTYFDDPHNYDPAFTRVRLRREVLPLLEQVLGQGVTEALGRTAEQLQADGAVLDALASAALDQARTGDDLDVGVLATFEPAIRRRVVRQWLATSGMTSLNSAQLVAVDHLISHWRGQGPVAVPGGSPGLRLVVRRDREKLKLSSDDQGHTPRVTRPIR